MTKEVKMAYKIYFLRNFLITKLRKFELQICAAPESKVAQNNYKVMQNDYKVAQSKW